MREKSDKRGKTRIKVGIDPRSSALFCVSSLIDFLMPKHLHVARLVVPIEVG